MNSTDATETIAKYDRILDLEQAVRISTAVQAFRGAGVSNYRAGQQDAGLAADKRRLYEAVDALTDEEAAHFLAYRKSEG